MVERRRQAVAGGGVEKLAVHTPDVDLDSLPRRRALHWRLALRRVLLHGNFTDGAPPTPRRACLVPMIAMAHYRLPPTPLPALESLSAIDPRPVQNAPDLDCRRRPRRAARVHRLGNAPARSLRLTGRDSRVWWKEEMLVAPNLREGDMRSMRLSAIPPLRCSALPSPPSRPPLSLASELLRARFEDYAGALSPCTYVPSPALETLGAVDPRTPPDLGSARRPHRAACIHRLGNGPARCSSSRARVAGDVRDPCAKWSHREKRESKVACERTEDTTLESMTGRASSTTRLSCAVVPSHLRHLPRLSLTASPVLRARLDSASPLHHLILEIRIRRGQVPLARRSRRRWISVLRTSTTPGVREWGNAGCRECGYAGAGASAAPCVTGAWCACRPRSSIGPPAIRKLLGPLALPYAALRAVVCVTKYAAARAQESLRRWAVSLGCRTSGATADEPGETKYAGVASEAPSRFAALQSYGSSSAVQTWGNLQSYGREVEPGCRAAAVHFLPSRVRLSLALPAWSRPNSILDAQNAKLGPYGGKALCWLDSAACAIRLDGLQDE
ncbi:hypothetical protein B0H19DRAFT_1271537 [Mycena capillaripes]|nr:hypothetical protein B0H19DRAFT_1271537 [Mycena capillaripes]